MLNFNILQDQNEESCNITQERGVQHKKRLKVTNQNLT
jgi:hypothetical protein